MKYSIQNAYIFVEIDSFGAEINRFLYENEEILYQKQEGFWQRQSPVLFPIVGGLKNKEYIYQEKRYTLPQHGFARDREFECVAQKADEIHFLLRSDEKTKENFPFDFELYIRYFLEEKALRVQYEVKNLSDKEMLYSLGGYPAFQIRTDINRYLLKFEKNMENQIVDRIHPAEFLLDENCAEKFPFGNEKNILPLDEKYFTIDAMIFRNIVSKKFDFCFDNQKIFTFEYSDFPHLGIWKQSNSPFICFEPWDGYVDVIDTNGQLENKAGIQKLKPQENRKYEWMVTF